MNNVTLTKAASADEFVRISVALIGDALFDTLLNQETCTLGLSGGTTPIPVYRALAETYDIPWDRIRFFLTDERYVPAGHADSNATLAYGTLLTPIGIPAEHVVFPDTSLALDRCIVDYDVRLRTIWNGRFDIVILGMGDDGHTASLFPPVEDTTHAEPLARHATTDVFAVHDRITLSYRALCEARTHIALLSGASKKATWNEMIQSEDGAARWPLKGILSASVDASAILFA